MLSSVRMLHGCLRGTPLSNNTEDLIWQHNHYQVGCMAANALSPWKSGIQSEGILKAV